MSYKAYKVNDVDQIFIPDPTGVASAYQTIENGGVPVVQRTIINFDGTLLVATDNAGLARTDITTPILTLANTWTKSQNVAQVALVDGANIATDASLGNGFSVTIVGNRTLVNPTNLVAGGTYIWVITQGAGGSHALAYGNLFAWPGGTAPTLSTAAGAVDIITSYYDGIKLRSNSTLGIS